MHDLEQAWEEGFRNAEILKRYTTTTMGPCQGAMCGRALSCFVAARDQRPLEPGLAAADPAVTTGVPARPRARRRDRSRSSRSRRGCTRSSTSERRCTSCTWPPAPGSIAPVGGCVPSPTATGARSIERSVERVEPDGRRHAREVHDRGRRRDGARRPAVPVPHRRSRTRPHPLRAHPRRGRLRDGRRPARPRRRRRVVPDLDVGRRPSRRRAPARPPRSSRSRRARARSHRAVGRDQRRGSARSRSARTPHRRRDRCCSGAVSGLRRRDGGRCRVPGDPHGVRRRAVLRAAPRSSPRPRALAGARRGGPRMGPAAPRPRCPRAASTREGARLSRAGHDARRHPREARHAVGGRCERSRGSWASGRSNAWPSCRSRVATSGFEFTGGPVDVAELRGEPLLADGAVVGRITSAERSTALERAIGLGWVRAVDGGFPDRLVDRVGRERRPWCQRPSTIRTAGGCVAELRVELADGRRRARPPPTRAIASPPPTWRPASGAAGRRPARCCSSGPFRATSWAVPPTTRARSSTTSPTRGRRSCSRAPTPATRSRASPSSRSPSGAGCRATSRVSRPRCSSSRRPPHDARAGDARRARRGTHPRRRGGGARP